MSDSSDEPPHREPLAARAARRERRRPETGTLRSLSLAAGPRQRARVDRSVPRLLLAWDGFARKPHGYAEAQTLLNTPAPRKAPSVSPQPTPPLREGTVRHRRP
ncbi:hypothetical protein GCM10010430_81130 [Kitasatospora cystarginea]|uniref:Uncharacterized protein n=1 Tax=Kitasatospora cystarginea TaxID=58350 RepID=A0ABN3F2X4_9ACTN